MQETSALYQELYMNPNHVVETRVAIGEPGLLLNEEKFRLVFGSTRILVASGGAEGGYGEYLLMSLKTSKSVFSNGVPEIGCCISGEIELKMLKPSGEIERRARITPYVRLRVGETVSEWVKKGVYYIDTRENAVNDDGINLMTIHGYDAMLMTEQLYPSTTLSFPAVDIDVVHDIASHLGIGVDPRTVADMTSAFQIPYPAQYTMRETLSFIAMMYCGNWIINDLGDLQLIFLNGLPPDVGLLTTEVGYRIVFGEDRIVV